MRNHSNKKRFDLHENGREGGRHFHMNGFARRFVFKRDSLSNLTNLIGLKIQNENSAHVQANAQKLGTVRVLEP